MNNTIENNKLIAEFMGYNVIKEPPIKEGIYIWSKAIDSSFPNKTLIESSLKYHTDWNWLMGVVQKIEEKGFVVAIRGISCAIYPVLQDKPKDYISNYVCGDLSKKIDIVYSAIIGFIKWYNQQN